MIPKVKNIEISVLIEPRIPGVDELSRALAFSSDGEEILALRIEFLNSFPVPVIDVYIPLIIRVEINPAAEHGVLITLLDSYGELFLKHDSDLHAVFRGRAF